MIRNRIVYHYGPTTGDPPDNTTGPKSRRRGGGAGTNTPDGTRTVVSPYLIPPSPVRLNGSIDSLESTLNP
jgi:hypothetical protein